VNSVMIRSKCSSPNGYKARKNSTQNLFDLSLNRFVNSAKYLS